MSIIKQTIKYLSITLIFIIICFAGLLFYFYKFDNQVIKFNENDMTSIIYPKNILSDNMLKKVEIINELYKKTASRLLIDTGYFYNCDLIVNKKRFAHYLTVTRVKGNYNNTKMLKLYNSYLNAQDIYFCTKPTFNLIKVFKINFPFEKYDAYNIYKNNKIVGWTYVILSQNKIIRSSLILDQKFEIDSNKIIEKK